MKRAQSILLLSIVICTMMYAQELKVFSLNAKNLIQIREEVKSKSKQYRQTYKKLLRDADKAIADGVFSVMEKEQTPPSGDKHDYMSMARYFWYDSSKPTGLPYIQKDGQTNPEVDAYPDRKKIDKTMKNSLTLALAYYFSGEEAYAEHATKVLTTWFLDPQTNMNPNLNYGQIVKGKEGGRPSGLIEMRGMSSFVDAVGLLKGSPSWTKEHQEGMKTWFEQYFAWLNENPIAVKEAATTNNHGTWFTGQKVAIALFLDKKDIARQLCEDAKTKIIETQITPEGEQPRELGRTRSLHYTHFNLEALFTLASLAENAGVDLWMYQTADGRSIKKALDWVLPVVTGEKEWEKQQIDEFKIEDFYPMLIQASFQFQDERYKEIAEDIGGDDFEKDRVNLLFPVKQ